uniref:Shikimate O-hydroxycinnamoyltransferase n=1 Tax=Ananas comosus var. bracteatus TaxID=296719 RepID=A0A6V7P474_ANACO|nr:unnamed protein product [Ananas comosus var. bracteatus]
MVEILESCLVAPSEETPKHALWLSNLDLAAAPGHTPTVYFYRPSGPGAFLPLAGRLGVGRDGRFEIDCNAEGVLFVAARCDYTVDSFREFKPSPETRRLFVPIADSADTPLVMLQVTFLKCGGVALGTAMHHFATDGPSAFHFIQTWASLARGEAADALPRPSSTAPSSAPAPHPPSSSTTEYSPDTFSARSTAPYVAAILKLSKGQIALLKSRASGGGSGYAVSTFRAVTAHVWRCLCVARKLAPNAQTRLYLPAQIRNHIKPPLPQHYFGNALIRVSAVTTVAELVNGSPSFAVEKIKSAVDKVNDVYVRSVIDYLELQGKRCVSARNGVRDTDLWAISWLGMPMYDADFGWGSRSSWRGRSSTPAASCT